MADFILTCLIVYVVNLCFPICSIGKSCVFLCFFASAMSTRIQRDPRSPSIGCLKSWPAPWGAAFQMTCPGDGKLMGIDGIWVSEHVWFIFNGLVYGKIETGNHRFSHEIWGFPAKVPLNQSIESEHVCFHGEIDPWHGHVIHVSMGKWMIYIWFTMNFVVVQTKPDGFLGDNRGISSLVTPTNNWWIAVTLGVTNMWYADSQPFGPFKVYNVYSHETNYGSLLINHWSTIGESLINHWLTIG